MMLDLGDPDQPKSATKAGLKQDLAFKGQALDLSEETNSKTERKLQKANSKMKTVRAKQTATVNRRVDAKVAKIKEKASMEIESVQASAYDEAEAQMGEDWGKDLALIKRLKVWQPQPYGLGLGLGLGFGFEFGLGLGLLERRSFQRYIAELSTD